MLITGIKVAKTDTSFLSCFFLAKNTLRYNSYFSHSFSK